MDNSGDVTAIVNYATEASLGTKPYWITYKRTQEEIDASHLKADRDVAREREVPVLIRNARNLEKQLTLDEHSFELLPWKTALSNSDFYNDEQKIHDVYYEEMREMLKKATGASYVHVFHHQLRNASKTTKTEESGDKCKIHRYAGG